MGRILAVVLLAAGMVTGTGSDAARASSPSELELPGAFFPESITAAPNGALFVSSLVTGEIVRFAPGSHMAETFVAEDVNVGTAGVMADPDATCCGPAPSTSASRLHPSCARSTYGPGRWRQATPCPTADCARTSRSHAATCT